MAKWSDIDPESLHPESLMMTYGFRPEWSEGAASPPIFQTSTFVFPSARVGARCFEIAYGLDEPRADEHSDLIYSRLNNPGLEIAEDRLALWDRADTAALFSSGMAAITTTLWAHLRPDVVAASSPIYGGPTIIEKVLPRTNHSAPATTRQITVAKPPKAAGDDLRRPRLTPPTN
jgi:methionine-gamma-lyase